MEKQKKKLTISGKPKKTFIGSQNFENKKKFNFSDKKFSKPINKFSNNFYFEITESKIQNINSIILLILIRLKDQIMLKLMLMVLSILFLKAWIIYLIAQKVF